MRAFVCSECGERFTIEVARKVGDRIYLMGKCKCGATSAVDVEKLFVLFYTPEQKGN